jgi:hypothetical protein
VQTFKKYKNNWPKILEETKFEKRSADNCKTRIESLMKSTIRGTWTTEEDNLIIKYCSKFGRNWALIASKINGRSGK